MLKLRRVSMATGFVIIGGICAAGPALADDGYGSTTCNQIPAPVCDLGAGKGGDNSKPGNPGSGNKPGRPGNGNPGKDNSNPGDTIIGGNSNLAKCSYVKSDYQPPSGGVVTAAFTKPLNTGGATAQPAVFTRAAAGGVVLAQAAQPAQGQQGSWYVWQCSTAGVTDGLYRPPVWIADGQQLGGAAAFAGRVGADGAQAVAAAHTDDRGEPCRRSAGELADVDVALERMGAGIGDSVRAGRIGHGDRDADVGDVVHGRRQHGDVYRGGHAVPSRD
jgi:hypothetical protein